MTIYELLETYYPEELKKLDKKFPKMIELSKEVEIIPWQEEFQIADKNADSFEKLEFLYELLKNKMISEEEYRKHVRELPPSSITKGIAIIEEKKVSFRNKIPEIGVIFHELGHIYFQEDDLTWNSYYGGGEVYAGPVYKDLADLSEEQIKKYMEIYRKIYNADDETIMKTYKLLSEIIVKGTDIPQDLVVAMLYAGTMPTMEIFKNQNDYTKIFDTTNYEKIKTEIETGKIELEPKHLKSTILMFISAYLADGYRYKDPFYKLYADNFFKNIEKIHKTLF